VKETPITVVQTTRPAPLISNLADHTPANVQELFQMVKVLDLLMVGLHQAAQEHPKLNNNKQHSDLGELARLKAE